MQIRPRRPGIVVFGSINMDLVSVVSRLPVAGETVAGRRFFTSPGGKGANQAVAAARLGARVRMVGRIGNDVFAPSLLAGLAKQGVDVSGVAKDPDRSSGIAVILLDADGENHIVLVPGANGACDDTQLREVEKALEDDADALMLQLEIPLEVSLTAARAAKRRGVRLIWDPAPATEMPPEAYSSIDILTPNQTEAGLLTGVPVTDVASAGKASEVLLDRGAAVVVVKLGDAGVYYAARGVCGHVPGFDVEVVDTVAAGDAFGGALAVALAEGGALEDALRYGAAAGALAVTRAGAQEAMPGREEIDRLLAQS